MKLRKRDCFFSFICMYRKGLEMRVAIVYGSPNKRGSTAQATQIFKKYLSEREKADFVEFYLPSDMPKFCHGCYNCFFKGEEHCPHVDYVKPFVEAFETADIIVLTTPVYVMAESAQMKALLDHLAYMFIPHRPNDKLFNTVGVVISTAAGGGMKSSMKSVGTSLSYWGVKRIVKAGVAIFAESFDKASAKKHQAIEKKMKKAAHKTYRHYLRRNRSPRRLHTRLMMKIMGLMKGKENNTRDKKHWIDKGWIKETV